VIEDEGDSKCPLNEQLSQLQDLLKGRNVVHAELILPKVEALANAVKAQGLTQHERNTNLAINNQIALFRQEANQEIKRLKEKHETSEQTLVRHITECRATIDHLRHTAALPITAAIPCRSAAPPLPAAVLEPTPAVPEPTPAVPEPTPAVPMPAELQITEEVCEASVPVETTITQNAVQLTNLMQLMQTMNETMLAQKQLVAPDLQQCIQPTQAETQTEQAENQPAAKPPTLVRKKPLPSRLQQPTQIRRPKPNTHRPGGRESTVGLYSARLESEDAVARIRKRIS